MHSSAHFRGRSDNFNQGSISTGARVRLYRSRKHSRVTVRAFLLEFRQ